MQISFTISSSVLGREVRDVLERRFNLTYFSWKSSTHDQANRGRANCSLLQPAWFIDDDIREDNVRLVPA